MIYITGDKHGDIEFIKDFCRQYKTTIEDVLIILGDVGFNYDLDSREKHNKKMVSKLPITVFCIHGNHEERPSRIKSYKLVARYKGLVFQEPKYPNILFAKDGEYYTIGKHSFLALGGAYSADKYLRLKNGWKWFENEQTSNEDKANANITLRKLNDNVDIVLSHTCPKKYVNELQPVYKDEHPIDYSQEEWLDEIENKIHYNKWLFGHYHKNQKINDKVYMLYDGVLKIYE